MNDIRIDEQLVADHLGGDRTALAGIYDRYADSLYDTAAAMLNDRHEAADAMQDVFLIAATRLDQLRDGSRLKPWLFAILRNQVFTRSKKRRRVLATDFSAPEAPEMVASTDPRAEGEQIAYLELAEMMRGATAGLDERDQLVLEYSLRQDLTGSDLADALGVSLDQSYVVVSRMRDRVERAIGALTVARMGRKDCVGLGDVLQDWNGTFSVLIRKRVARHIEQCDTCERTKRKFAVIPMMGAAPALAAPPDLRGRILDLAGVASDVPVYGYGFRESGGFPSPLGGRRLRQLLVVGIVALLVLLLGAAALIASSSSTDDDATAESSVPATILVPTDPVDAATIVENTVAENPPTVVETTVVETTVVETTVVETTVVETTVVETTVVDTTVVETTVVTKPPVAVPPVAVPPPTTAPLAPGQLDISSGSIDLGTSASSGAVTLTNSGQRVLEWSLANGSGVFGVSAASGTLLPAQAVAIEFTIDRGTVGEGFISHDASIASSAGGGGVVQVRATIDRSPQVAIVQGAPGNTCPPIEAPTIIAGVSDESSLTSVVLSWSGPGAPGSANMTQNGGNWSAPLGVDYVEGTWSFTVRATDSRGNVGTASGTAVVLCPTPG